MRIDKFEQLVSYKKMRIERREKFDCKEIYIAEGYCSGDIDESAPHIKTMYAISDGPERITVGEFFTTPILFPMKQKSDRLNEAMERAKQFHIDMVGGE